MIGQASGPRLLPWQNWDEWVHVRGLLWSPDPVDRNEGVLRVAAWRCRERVPHAVECTAQLVEVALHEWRCSTYPGQYGRNSLQLRLMYSSVIVRTVNGLVEAHQKCAHAISIQQIARQIGIPSWLVDLRHDAAHKDMPSLASFRLASAFLLDYLSQRYWDVQQQNLTAWKDAQIQLLLAYAEESATAFSGADSRNDNWTGSRALKPARRAPQRCDEVLDAITTNLTPTAAAHLLVPRLAHLISESGHVNNTSTEAAISGGSFNDCQALWMPLIAKMQAQWSGFVPALVVSIVEDMLLSTSENNDTTSQQLQLQAQWIAHLLSGGWHGTRQPSAGEDRSVEASTATQEHEGLVLSALHRCSSVRGSPGAAAAAEVLRQFASCNAGGCSEKAHAGAQSIPHAAENVAVGGASGAAQYSLEAMEAFLHTRDAPADSVSTASTCVADPAAWHTQAANANAVVQWQKCEQWTPCAVGTLPGWSSSLPL